MTGARGEQSLSKRQFLAELTIIALVFIVAVACVGGAAYYLIVVRAQIAPGDTLSIQVVGLPHLSGEARVNDAGQVRIIGVGMVPVSGLSIERAGNKIASLLAIGSETQGGVGVEIEVLIEKLDR